MKNNVLVMLFLSGSFVAAAQSDSTANLSYYNSFHAGALLGKKGYGSGGSFATIHGVRFRKLSFGIGIGYDAYQEWRTVPVFASFAHDFLALRGNSFFIQLNAGYSRAWHALEEQEQFSYEEERGACFHPLVGYRIHSNKFDLYLTAGYKFQAINYVQTPDWSWAPESKVSVGRDMERISIQLGFGLH